MSKDWTFKLLFPATLVKKKTGLATQALIRWVLGCKFSQISHGFVNTVILDVFPFFVPIIKSSKFYRTIIRDLINTFHIIIPKK